MTEAVFKHSLTYPDYSKPSLTEIANTLIAHEKLAALIGEVLEKAVDGIKVESVRIELEQAELGSLHEHFFVALFVFFQKDLEKDLPDVIEALTGVQVPERYDTLVTVLFLLLLFWGSRYVTARVRRREEAGPAPPPPPAVQGDYNTYVHIAAGQLNVPPERIEQAVEAVATKGNRRQTLSRAAVDLFRPAKRGGNGRIVPAGTPEVSQAAIEEFPNEAALADLGRETEIEPYAGVVLAIRATDRDKRAQGWAGILEVDGLEKRRVPVTLYPTIDVASLAQCERARVDAMAEFKDIGEDERLLIRIHVIVVHECLDRSPSTRPAADEPPDAAKAKIFQARPPASRNP